MTENEQKQQFIIAYLHAGTSRAGFTCQATLVDDDSVDVVVGARGWVHQRAGRLTTHREDAMNVRVRILFDSPSESDRDSLVSLGRRLTNDPQSVRVFARTGAPKWLVVEFTMPTEAQYKAVETIDRAIRFGVYNRMDTIIEFPKSAAEQERNRRKAQERRARRRSPDAD